jgi:4'-phosphopantetheinyl transferase
MSSRLAHPSSPPRDGEIHLWRVFLGDAVGLCSRQARWLSPEELRRADAYRFDRDRQRFVAARGELRRILTAYTGVPSGRIELGSSAAGKPFLLSPGPSLHFNISHSGDQALMAFSSDGEVGVDLEEIPSESRPEDLLPTICSAGEQLRILTLPPARRARALLRLWTAKEAFLKATGAGLQIAPDRLEVDAEILLGEGGTTRVRWAEALHLSELYRLYPLPECEIRWQASAALAVRWTGTPHRIQWFTGEDEESPLPHRIPPLADASDARRVGPRG